MTENTNALEDIDEGVLQMWTFAALAIGFNELAKMQETLEQKCLARALRLQAEATLAALGEERELFVFNEPSILDMPSLPGVRFLPSDVELMRAVVAAHDAKEKP